MKLKRLCALLLCAVLLFSTIPIAAAAYSGKPIIASNPATLTWPEGSTAIWTCDVTGDEANELEYRWYLTWNGTTYCVNEVNEFASDALTQWPWLAYVDMNASLPAGVLGNSLMISGIQSGLNGAEVFCKVDNAGYVSETEHALVMVGSSSTLRPPKISTPAYVTCTQGDSVTLKCSAEARETGYSIGYIWYTAQSVDIMGITAVNRGSETSASFKPDTSNPGLYFYFCGVITGEGLSISNISYSGATILEVLEKEEEQYLDMTINNLPTKRTYEIGEKIDLSGLQCRVTTSNGYLNISNGENMTVSPETATEAGQQTVTVNYEGVTAQFSITVNAAAPSAPLIAVQPISAQYTMEEQPNALSAVAVSAEGAELKYQWYYSTEADGARHNIEGATAASYTPNAEEGTKYYGCAIKAVNADGKESDPVWTDTAAVTFTAVIATPEPDPATEPDPTEAPATDGGKPDETETPATDDGTEDEKIELGTGDKKKDKDKDKDDDTETSNSGDTNGWLWAFIGVAILLVGAAAALTVLLLKRRDSEF